MLVAEGGVIYTTAKRAGSRRQTACPKLESQLHPRSINFATSRMTSTCWSPPSPYCHPPAHSTLEWKKTTPSMQ